ncbi:ABC transporter permease, partial [Leucobacter sp. M11]|uniref:ABC transporter permease n=1 Tax=Leucobacter sp. M11 TaxID=2993565 RepID=UPI002D7F2CB0
VAGGRSVSERITALPGVRSIGKEARSSTSLTLSALPPGVTDRVTVSAPDVRFLDAEAFAHLGAQWRTPAQSAWLDPDSPARVAMLGPRLAEGLGLTVPGPGATIWIENQPFAWLEAPQRLGADARMEGALVLSLDGAAVFPAQALTLSVRAEAGYALPLANAIPAVLNPGDPGAVSVSAVADLRQLSQGVAEDLSQLIALVSVVLLVIASLGSATSMYLSVQARAPEVALRRALGASRAVIWRLFMLEGFLIGVVGGTAGTGIGLIALVGVSAARGWTPVLAPAVVAVGITAGALAGVLSAAYPAWVAARAEPAEAIRK